MAEIKRILLIDDDETTNFFTEYILGRYNKGFDIDICLNGKAGVDYLKSTEHLPDLILLDINMPLMNGFEFLEWQSNSPFREIRVVMYSSSKNEDDLIQANKHKQVVGYVEKPFDLDTVKALFEEIG